MSVRPSELDKCLYNGNAHANIDAEKTVKVNRKKEQIIVKENRRVENGRSK